MFTNATLTDDDFTNETFVCEMLSPDNPVKSPYFRGTVYTVYTIIFVVSVVGNGFVCYIVLSSPRMRTVTNYFITNLAVGELLITILCVPFTTVAVLEQYWPFGMFLCTITSYSQCLSVLVSAYTLVAISIDKYMVIMWPLKPRISKRCAATAIALVWFIAGLTVLPTGMISNLVQPNASIYEVCDKYICREDYSEVGPDYEYTYSMVLMLLQYVIPSGVLIFTYTRIGVAIWCHRIPGEAENSRDQRIAKSKKKMIKMMVTVVFVYSLCWLPYNLLTVMGWNIKDSIRPYLFFALHALAMSHPCYNPIIYCYMNTRFRAGFLQTICLIPCCRKYFQAGTGSQPTGIEGTESTMLQRNNTCTTYISMKRKNCNRINSCNHQLPVRSASLMRNPANGNQSTRRIRYSGDIIDEQI